MELVSHLESMAARFANPQGLENVFVPDLVDGIQRKFKFWEYPKSMAEFLQENGASFGNGIVNGIKIRNLTLFKQGLFVREFMNTKDIDSIIDIIIEFILDNYNISYINTPPVLKAFNSAIVVRMSPDIMNYILKFGKLSEQISKMVSEYGFTSSKFQVSSLSLQPDPSKTVLLQPGKFVIERRAGYPFEEGLFYSTAPVSTEQHLNILLELERSI